MLGRSGNEHDPYQDRQDLGGKDEYRNEAEKGNHHEKEADEIIKAVRPTPDEDPDLDGIDLLNGIPPGLKTRKSAAHDRSVQLSARQFVDDADSSELQLMDMDDELEVPKGKSQRRKSRTTPAKKSDSTFNTRRKSYGGAQRKKEMEQARHTQTKSSYVR
jgi:hypothetical protein